jgi:hypothetical protein
MHRQVACDLPFWQDENIHVPTVLLGKFYNKEHAGHDLYYLWQHLHYIWPRRAPHRPTRPARGLGRPVGSAALD